MWPLNGGWPLNRWPLNRGGRWIEVSNTAVYWQINQDFGKWLLNGGWPLNRWPLNRGRTATSFPGSRIFFLHCNSSLRISGFTNLCYIKTRTNVKIPLYLKKAGLASRNIVHLQKIIPRCVGFCFCIFFIYMWSRLDHFWSNVYQQDHRSGCVLKNYRGLFPFFPPLPISKGKGWERGWYVLPFSLVTCGTMGWSG